MKFCITTTGPDLDSKIDPRFGRCQYLLFVDFRTGKLLKSIPNTASISGRGAGVATAQRIVSEKAQVIITGNIGPNAFNVLSTSQIKIYLGFVGLSAKQILEKYRQGKLEKIARSNVNGHFGLGSGGPGRGLRTGLNQGGGRRRGRI